MKSEAEANAAVEEYGDTIRRVCFLHLKNYADVEDVFQDVFLKYILYEQGFQSKDHEKAWLIRVAINRCKDLLKSFAWRRVTSLDGMDTAAIAVQESDGELLGAVLRLPDKYRDVIYLYYYEGYNAVEIAEMLGKRVNTIYTWLARAKARLKDMLGGEPIEG